MEIKEVSMKKGFDNNLYLKLQTESILKRMKQFDNKIYIEFGGKLFDDYHASRVLPGFKPDVKLEVLKKIKDKCEVLFCISAKDIDKSKTRSDIGITYDMDVIRLIKELNKMGILANNVVITQYKGTDSANIYKKRLERMGVNVYFHTLTKGYPTDIDTIVSDEGYGANPYIKTTKPVVIVSAPGPGSGKLATCLSQLYHEYKLGIKSGYAKYETFPIWNLPLKHPINLAYEAATADLKDINLIDSFYLEETGKTAVNYNRDMEMFPVLKRIMKKITNEDIYNSPTQMGVNMAGFAINDEQLCIEASLEEIIRRYYRSLRDYKLGIVDEDVPRRIKMMMNELNISEDNRKVVKPCLDKTSKEKVPVLAIMLKNKKIITGKRTNIMTPAASCILNALKILSKIDDIHLLSPVVLDPVLKLKKELFDDEKRLLNLQDVLLCLSICAATNEIIVKVLDQLVKLTGCEAHSSFILDEVDEKMLRSLHINLTSDAIIFSKNYFLK